MRTGTQSADPHGENLRGPAAVSRMLKQLLASHALLSVRLDDGRRQYASLVLQVDRGQENLVLDELAPEAGHERVQVGSRLSIGARHLGVEVNFASVVDALGRKSGSGLYRLPFPDRVAYRQRRAYFRVLAGLAQSVHLAPDSDAEEVVVADLLDVSIGGFSATLTQDVECSDELAARLAHCTLVLPGGEKLRCGFEARRVSAPGTRGDRTLHAQFLDLREPDKRALQRLVAQLERERLKTRAR